MSHRITLKEFQSFDQAGAGVSAVGRINILVGPNNAGKSKILRAIDRTINDHQKSLISETGASYVIEIERELTERDRRTAFPEGVSYSSLGDAWHTLGQNLEGTSVTLVLNAQKSVTSKELKLKMAPALGRFNQDLVRSTVHAGISKAVTNDSFEKFSPPVYYIAAERDVKPEGESKGNVGPNGVGVTNLFREILTTAGVSKDPIEKWLLLDLNRLLAPDHQYSRIQILRQPTTGAWEIFLEEEGKGLVPLTQCGSGLRTLVHLLAYTNLVAKRADGKITSGTFLFEELENCLHPHVQRNLFAYLDDIVALPARVFLTTHSSVCLDYFQGHKDVVLTHVYQDEGKTRSRIIDAFADRCGVLDRMGSRASEALQSNAVIWVEGPSDRTYLKHWFALSDAQIAEGRDYSITFYGGDLLAHLTMSAEQELEEYIRLLRINRNSAIIIDSDKTYQAEPIRETKRRVKEEAEAQKRIAWITKGKEIENYLTSGFFQRIFETPPTIGNYEPPWAKLRGLTPKGSSKSFQTKVEFAEFVRRNTTKADFQLDWQDRTQELVEFVLKANGRIG